MRWFKHMTNASSDDKMVKIRTQFGLWGEEVYWKVLEVVAGQMKGANPVPVASLNIPEFCSICKCKRNKLETFLDCLQNVCGMKLVRVGDNFEVTIPKLLQIKKNHLMKLDYPSKNIPIESRVQSTDTDIESRARDENSFEFKTAKRFYDKQKGRYPTLITLEFERVSSDWIDGIRKLRDTDGHSEAEIIGVLKYVCEDEFWSKNIRSIAKLRRKDREGTPYFNVIQAKIPKRKPTGPSGISAARASIEGATPGQLHDIAESLGKKHETKGGSTTPGD